MARSGKVIDRWKFTINRIQIEVPVRMLTPRHGDQKTQFFVDFSYEGQQLWQQSNNIDDLMTSVKKWLKDVATVEYQPYFYVTFSGHVESPRDRTTGNHVFSPEEVAEIQSQETGEVQSCLEWRLYHVGKTISGKTMHRDCSRRLNMGNWIEGDPATGIDKESVHHNWSPEIAALVPATPENATALEKLADAFSTLHANLMKFLHPNAIEQSLAHIVSNLPMLLEHQPQSHTKS